MFTHSPEYCSFQKYTIANIQNILEYQYQRNQRGRQDSLCTKGFTKLGRTRSREFESKFQITYTRDKLLESYNECEIVRERDVKYLKKSGDRVKLDRFGADPLAF